MKNLISVLALAASLMAAAPPARPPQVPRPVGKMVFNSTKGPISMEKYRGKVTVVMFFSSACSHCGDTAQILEKVLVERKYDFAVIGVTVEDPAMPALGEFAKRNKLSFPMGWVGKDEFFRYTDISPDVRPFIPVLLFIDKDFQVNRQYSHDHKFFTTGEQINATGVVDMLVRTPLGKAKDLPRTSGGGRPLAPVKK